MKKQTQSLIICSTILALLVSILILLISMPNSEITDTSMSESVNVPEAFISKKIEDISKIQIKNLENEVNIIANKNEGNIEFTIPELASKNVSKTNVEDFVKEILNMSPIQVVQENEDDLSTYGLNGDVPSISVFDNSGGKVVLKLGAEAPLSIGNYLRINDEHKIYLISPFYAELFKGDTERFLNKQ